MVGALSVFTEGLVDDPLTQDALEPTASERRRAAVAETWSTLVGPSLVRWAELDEARRWGGGAYPEEYGPDEARKFFEDNGVGGMLTPEDRTYNRLELSILTQRKQAEIRRQYTLQRAKGGFAEGGERLLLALGTSLGDPLTVASAFVPVVSQSRYARLVAGARGVVGRAGVRAAVGAAEGGVGAALVEPFVYGAKRAEQADYDAYDSLANIAFGTIFGGGLHVVGGAVADVLAGRREAAVAQSVAELQTRLQELEQAGKIAPTGRADAAADPYFDRAKSLLAELRAAKLVDSNDPRQVSAFVGFKAKPLSQFIRETGGINDIGGELAARDVTNKRAPGLVRRDNMGAASVDAVRQRVFDEGYFPGKTDYNEISDSELFDAIADDLFNQKRYTMDVQERLGAADSAADLHNNLAMHGITKDMSPSDVAVALRDLDEAMRAPEDGGATAENAAEWDRMAAEIARRADPETREAALRAAVAQDLSGEPRNVEPVFELDPATRTRPADQALDGFEPVPRTAPETPAMVEATDEAALNQQLTDLQDNLKALEAERMLDGAELPADLRVEIEAADEAVTQSKSFAEAARMAVACAMRAIL